jgi:hypothetical protein
MREILIIALVLAMIVVPCLAIAFGGIWVSRRLGKRAPGSRLLHRLTPLELVLLSGLLVVFLVGAVIRELHSQTPLGAFLNNPVGIVAAFILACVLYSVTHALLSTLLRRRAR